MGYRNIFIVNGSNISTENEQLILTSGECRSIPIEDINSVVVDNLQTSISSAALSKLSEYGATVIITDKSHLPKTVLLPANGYCRQLKILNLQINASKVFYKQLWKSIITAKIRNQAEVLKLSNIPEWTVISDYANRVKSGDADNVEAVAAHKYFRLLFGDDFSRNGGNLINSHLNYGYAVIRSCIAKQLCVSGFEPCLGIFHHNQLNNFNLADDLIEPFRPIVDLFAKQNTKERSPYDDFTLSDRAGLINLLNADVLIEGKKYALSYAIELTISALANKYKDNDADFNLPKIIPLKNHSYE